MVPWLETRDGNVPAKFDNRRALEEALLQLPGAVRHVTLRTDGAGHQEDVIRACNDPAFRREETRRFGTVGLICGATRSEQLMDGAASRQCLAPDDGAERRREPHLECAELCPGDHRRLRAEAAPCDPLRRDPARASREAWERENCRRRTAGRPTGSGPT